MVKKLITAAGAAVLAAAMLSGNVFAEEYQRVNLYIDGTEIASDQPAVIYNSRTVIPLRAVMEVFDCNVDWDNATKTVIISQGEDNSSIYMTVGSAEVTAVMDGESYTQAIDAPPIIINGRTMIPLAFLGDTLGYDVNWDGNTKTAYVSTEFNSGGSQTPSDSDLTDKIRSKEDIILNYMKLITDCIANDFDLLTSEQFYEYSALTDEFFAIDTAVNDIGEETYKKLESIESRFVAFMAECGIDTANIKTEPASAEAAAPINERLTVFYDDDYDSYTDYVVSEAMAVQILETNKLLLEGLSGYMEQMSENNLEVFASLSKTAGEYAGKITDNMEESTNIILSLNTTNCDLAAMAEGLGIDLGENMKEYTVNINNPVYYSSNETEVLAAKTEALKTHNRYNDIIENYYNNFTDKQFDEYNRITNPDTYFMFQYNDKENIEYYRGSLKLLDKMNARTEIFAKKYGISLS